MLTAKYTEKKSAVFSFFFDLNQKSVYEHNTFLVFTAECSELLRRNDGKPGIYTVFQVSDLDSM